MGIIEVMDMPAYRTNHVFWPTLLTIDSRALFAGLYNRDPDVDRYVKAAGIKIPEPGSEDPEYRRSVEKAKMRRKIIPNLIHRVVLPYAEQDGVTLDVRDMTTYADWRSGVPKDNEVSKKLMRKKTKGEYYRLVHNVPCVYVVLLTSDQRILCSVIGNVTEGSQLRSAGEAALVGGIGNARNLCEMALEEIEEELGLIKADFHFLDKNLKPVPWSGYRRPNPEVIEPDKRVWTRGVRKFDTKFDRNIPPFMILDELDFNAPAAAFLAGTELDWDRFYKLLMEKRERGEIEKAGAEENSDFFSVVAEPETMRAEVQKERWGNSGDAQVLLHFADFLESR